MIGVEFNIGVPSLNRPLELYKFIVSVLQSSVLPKNIIIIDNSSDGSITKYITETEIPDTLIEAANKVHFDFLIAPFNLGVSASWNYLMDTYAELPIIISNDDLELHTNTLERMLERRSDNVVVCGESSSGNAFSLFLLPQTIYQSVGKFDESYLSGYYSDNDYYYRMHWQGYELLEVAGATYDHVGSATLKAYTPEQTTWHHTQFQLDREYYIQQHGGLPGFEKE